jgi:hypothetical protein
MLPPHHTVYGAAQTHAPDSRRLVEGFVWDKEGTAMVNYDAAAERRLVLLLSRIALIAMGILLTVGAVNLFGSWPADPILQFLR